MLNNLHKNFDDILNILKTNKSIEELPFKPFKKLAELSLYRGDAFILQP
jgi:hypothetical protein